MISRKRVKQEKKGRNVRNEQRDNKVLKYVTPTGVAGPYDSSLGSSTLISMREIFDNRLLAEALNVLLEAGAVGRHAPCVCHCAHTSNI